MCEQCGCFPLIEQGRKAALDRAVAIIEDGPDFRKRNVSDTCKEEEVNGVYWTEDQSDKRKDTDE